MYLYKSRVVVCKTFALKLNYYIDEIGYRNLYRNSECVFNLNNNLRETT